MNFFIITLSIIIIFLLFILYRVFMGIKSPVARNLYLKSNEQKNDEGKD